MPSITPFLWFDDRAEDAIAFYRSVFGETQVETRAGGRFRILGREFIAFNGGPHFTLTPAISLFVSCATQAEIDRYWGALCEGGSPGRCGWLTDRFGLSWQIVPELLVELLGTGDRAVADRVHRAMLGMGKFEIDALERARDGR